MAKNNIKFELEGLEEVQKMLKALPEELNEKFNYDVNRKAANIVKTDLKQSTPKDSGEASKSVAVVKIPNTKTGVSLGYLKKAFYLRFYEHGRKDQQARPFVSGVHQSAIPKALNYIQRNIAKMMERTIKKYNKRFK